MRYFASSCLVSFYLRLVELLRPNQVAEGTAVIVHGRLQMDTFTNSHGQQQTSVAYVAQKTKLAARSLVEVSQ